MINNLDFVIIYDDGTQERMSDKGIWVNSFDIPAPDIEVTTIDVPGRAGSYVLGKRIKERQVTIGLTIDEKNYSDVEDKKSLIYDLFYRESTYTIVRDINKNKRIKVDQSGSYNLDYIGDSGGTIDLTLMMYEPFIYSMQKEKILYDTVGGVVDQNVINYQGNQPAYPIFTANILKPISYLQCGFVPFLNNGRTETMLIGQPNQEDTPPVQKYEPVIIDDLESFDNWSTVADGTALRSGLVGGAMGLYDGIDGTPIAFTPTSYGTNPNGYVGPAKRLVLDEPLQDFRIEFDLTSLNDDGGMGKVFLLLYDEFGNSMGYLCMEDAWNDFTKNRAQVILGLSPNTVEFINTSGVHFDTVYNHFHGQIWIERQGQTFNAESMQIKYPSGLVTGRFQPKPFLDTGDRFQNRLAQVVIHIVKYKTFPVFRQYARAVRIYKVNDLSQTNNPYIANAGDIITFDHVNKVVRLNGDDSLMQQLDIGSTFFPLERGVNVIDLQPAGSSTLTARWEDVNL